MMVWGRETQLYYNWLYGIVCGKRVSGGPRYHRLSTFLFNEEFVPRCSMDIERADDGVALRSRFEEAYNIKLDRIESCSMLEMMIALSDRIERTIMIDRDMGDRTGQWFWNMVVSLGFSSSDDRNFDEEKARTIMERFNCKEYAPNGAGGLFTVQNTNVDMRKLDIWYQAMAYLNETFT